MMKILNFNLKMKVSCTLCCILFFSFLDTDAQNESFYEFIRKFVSDGSVPFVTFVFLKNTKCYLSEDCK